MPLLVLRPRAPTSGPPLAGAAAAGAGGDLCPVLARFLLRPAARGGSSANSAARAPTWSHRVRSMQGLSQNNRSHTHWLPPLLRLPAPAHPVHRCCQ
jgi:hypothetical protein